MHMRRMFARFHAFPSARGHPTGVEVVGHQGQRLTRRDTAHRLHHDGGLVRVLVTPSA